MNALLSPKPNRRKRLALRFAGLVAAVLALGIANGPRASRAFLLQARKVETLPDGSKVTIAAVSYGTLHRDPSPYGHPPRYFKAERPTIMFTTYRTVGKMRALSERYTIAEAKDASGRWFLLRSREMLRPSNREPLEFPHTFSGPDPTEVWETWEFPTAFDVGKPVRVRVFLGESKPFDRGVEFDLPNDAEWRERSARETAKGFNSKAWLDSEMIDAAPCGDVEYIKQLIAQGANINASSGFMMSPLAMACQNGFSELVRYLVEHGADVNYGSGVRLGRTPLMAACSNNGHLEITRYLIEHGADINATAEKGWTGLVWAAREGDAESVKYLLLKGANPRIKAIDGRTIIELTKQTEYEGHSRCAVLNILENALKSK
jgi:hypothetical protein